jgi:small conductance mechanosensitive channel
MVDWQQYGQEAVDVVVAYAPRFLAAVLVLVIGLWLANVAVSVIVSAMQRRDLDTSLRRFLKSFLGIAFKILVFITVISMLGVQMTSFVAILGAAGLAVGLALQGSLANFAGGVLILTFKPFEVGDFIEVDDFSGTVHAIQIFSTVLHTVDNKEVVIPNAELSNNAITNYSGLDTRRADVSVGISYDADIQEARDVLLDVADAHENVHDEPAPKVVVTELAGSSVNLSLRCWTDASVCRSTEFDLTEQVKVALDEAGIGIPYPQLDLHLFEM